MNIGTTGGFQIGIPVLANALVITPTTQIAWASDWFACKNDTGQILLTIASLSAGQTLAVRIRALDANGNVYFYGTTRLALNTNGNYVYMFGQYTATGGGLPSDGQFLLPAPAKMQIQLLASDTSGTKPATISVCYEDRK